ncbi:MAG: DUF1223 domain-containing protein [Candidatus Acidiferrales bacterium]
MSRVRFAFSGMAAVLLLGALSLPRLVEAVGGDPHLANESAQRNPVLVELFTSEGCSDCPPADALLERLDRSQPVSGADLIVLSEHVDYWNDIGWKDPFSSREYSERQGAYASEFGLSGVYTPQMIVDGRIQLVGSDEKGAIHAIENASRSAKIPVSLSSIHFDGEKIVLHLETGPSPSSIPQGFANVLLAIADERDQSNVSRGENAGRTLNHVAVLRDLVRVGALDRSGNFSQDVAISFNHGNKGNLRIVAIVQEPTAGRVLGVGSARLSN